jgi:hypothetical protein
MDNKKPLLALALMCAAGLTHAGEKEELLKLRNTTTSLIKQLVKQGVLTDKMAEDMLKQAEADANQQVAEAKAASSSKEQEVVPTDEVRVAYVPDFVKDEIRQQVRSELREEVVGDVMQKAKKEQWGMPNALPEWTRKFKLSGDLRLREQSELMAKDNAKLGNVSPYVNWMTVNDRAGADVEPLDAAYLNTSRDRNRLRERLRLAIDADITEGLSAGIRLATGNIRNPTSTNQTLGNMGDRYDFRVDRAFLKYDLLDDEKFSWLNLTGGRIVNPFFTAGSELVWDEDLSFEGASASVRHRFGNSDSLGEIGSNGPTVFATVGAFPLSESAFSTNNKWLFGGQTGLDWGFANQDNLKVSVGYFDYQNIKANSINDTINHTCDVANQDVRFSVPQFMQYGNSLTPICQGGTARKPSANLSGLVGLASDYKILNLNIAYDLALFAPHHFKLSADYAQNLGFNLNDIQSRYKTVYGAGSLYVPINSASNTGWQVRADLGWPKVDVGGHWSVFSFYKYLGSDAVLDAYTDSDLHLGGTNVKGWVLGGNYGLMKNVWLTGRWLSGNVITGPQYGVDLLQFDINTRF